MPEKRDYPEHLLDSSLGKRYQKGEFDRGEFYALTEYSGRELRQRIYDEIMSKKKKVKKVKK